MLNVAGVSTAEVVSHSITLSFSLYIELREVMLLLWYSQTVIQMKCLMLEEAKQGMNSTRVRFPVKRVAAESRIQEVG